MKLVGEKAVRVSITECFKKKFIQKECSSCTSSSCHYCFLHFSFLMNSRAIYHD